MSDEYSFGFDDTRSKMSPQKNNNVMSPGLEIGHEVEKAGQDSQMNMPTIAELQAQLVEAGRLVDDIVLKKYLYNLTGLEVIPLHKDLQKIDMIRLFKITEMVYQKDEYSTYKFASVFSAVQNLNCGIFIIADSDGTKTEFYMGVRSFDEERTTNSLKKTLQNALQGQFPGVKTQDIRDTEAKQFLASLPKQNIAAVSCVANNKDEDFKDNKTFIQGLEKLALAMQGQKYTAIILAKSTPAIQLDGIRKAYESIYTQISPFANMQLSYGENIALSVSDALSYGTTRGTSYTLNEAVTKGESISIGFSKTHSVSKNNPLGSLLSTVGAVAAGAIAVGTAPFTLGTSLIAGGAAVVGALTQKTTTDSTTQSENRTTSTSLTSGESWGENESSSETISHTRGTTSGSTKNMQLTMQNKTLINTMERIEQQLKRIDECESIGMWECAAYFLSDSQETAEMAAGTYKALVKGTKTGLETSIVNYWGRHNASEQLPLLREYVSNFVHPVFAYRTGEYDLPVTTASLVSSNELAIEMGLPRKSVCGFPVMEHADFGLDVVKYDNVDVRKKLCLGNVFSMGSAMETKVDLDVDSLTMHTFVTGSTGSGKSNTIYEMLYQLRNVYGIPFLVIEPAKGEYKNAFGRYSDVTVYGTNPKKTDLLRLNPFRFPSDIHVLEHMERLVEIFNVCWPMYAAMPAVLKTAMENAYRNAGWDLIKSENKYGNIYPSFIDVAKEVEKYINKSEFSDENKGNYKGALLTRLQSLTTGINNMIFSADDIPDEELFDNSAIVDLSRIGSVETKVLIMGLLVLKLQEHRIACASGSNSSLKHITILEEAHNLLKRTSTEQSAESSNLMGKSVEMLSNAIAEMRTYGEGFIIADQSPGLLDMSVIRNTNTKIIMRLPDFTDRELVGKAASLNDDQIVELSKLPRGVAAIYQNDWVSPVLCKVAKAEIQEENYIQPVSALIKEDDHLIFDLLDAKFRERLDDDYLNAVFREDVLRSSLPTEEKVRLLSFLKERNKEKGNEILASMLFDHFNGTKKTLELTIEEETIDMIRQTIIAELTPTVIELSDEKIDALILFLLKEYVDRYRVNHLIWQEFESTVGQERVR